jgi:hypothetical protein
MLCTIFFLGFFVVKSMTIRFYCAYVSIILLSKWFEKIIKNAFFLGYVLLLAKFGYESQEQFKISAAFLT